MYIIKNQFYRYYCVLICSIFLHFGLNSQSLHFDSLSRVYIPELTSSVWGMTHSSGLELALLGTRNGLRVYDLSMPSNPKEILFVPGNNCLWRELKSYKNYIYVVTECEDGLLIVDLNDLNNIQYKYIHTYLDASGNEHEITTSHTLFIDEKGYLYLAGANHENAGFGLLSLSDNPYQPIWIFSYNEEYFHEVYVVNDFLYGASLFLGEWVLIDLKDRSAPKRINSQHTGFRFTHSLWLEDQRPILYSADEREGAFIEAWDITDLNRIKLLDKYRPNFPFDKMSIPHNCFYKDGYLFISWYTEGVRVLDVRDPTNLVEVAYFDTHPQKNVGFHGCWNVYPYFKSGIILASDIENGMYVLRFNENHASYLKGKVTDQNTGLNLENVEIQLNTTTGSTIAYSNLIGEYSTGYANPETIQVQVSKPGYYPIKIDVQLIQDSIITQNFELLPLPSYKLELRIVNQLDGEPLSNVKIRLWDNYFVYDQLTDQNGTATITNVFEGSYLFQSSSWGKLHYSIPELIMNKDTLITIELKDGYEDQFNIPLPWNISPDNKAFQWKQGDFSELFPAPSNYPSKDIKSDIGNSALYTNNFDDADPGKNVLGDYYLYSPIMDLSRFDEIDISYTAWAYGGWDSSIKETYLQLKDKKIPLENIEENLNGRFNEESKFKIKLENETRDSAYFVIHLWNDPDSAKLAITLKAALDGFKLTGRTITQNSDPHELQISCYPNPFTEEINVVNQSNKMVLLECLNMDGKKLAQTHLSSHSVKKIDDWNLKNGIYYLRCSSLNMNIGKTFKLIKL